KLGLNLYDYSARQMDNAVPRFTSIDPHAEKYYSWSPYVYGGNNPILNIDPDGRDYWSTNDPELIKQFLNSMGRGSSVHDMSSWNHATDAEFLGRGTFNDETGKFHTSYGTVIDGIATVIGVSFDTNLKPGATSEGMGYPGAFVYSYNNDFPSALGANFGGRLYTDAYNLVQGGIFSSLYADEYAFDPTYYDDGTTGWAVNTAGRITGEYEESDMSFIPTGGGKGGKLGFAKEHKKNARASTKGKHQAGQKRKQVDYGGERGDTNRRPPRQKPNGWKGPWPPRNGTN
ncbi:MAG: RHS repeat-associated core domain-containing protein, partial [Dysgonomonas sp.]